DTTRLAPELVNHAANNANPRSEITPAVSNVREAWSASPKAGEEGQCYQVCSDAKSQLHNPTIAHNSFALGKTNLHVVMVKEGFVEGMHCLVYGLLGDEKQSSMIRVIT